MTTTQTLKIIENMEANANVLLDNAHRLLEDAAILKEELSGGSDGSTPQVFSINHQQQIIERRRKHQYKNA